VPVIKGLHHHHKQRDYRGV